MFRTIGDKPDSEYSGSNVAFGKVRQFAELYSRSSRMAHKPRFGVIPVTQLGQLLGEPEHLGDARAGFTAHCERESPISMPPIHARATPCELGGARAERVIPVSRKAKRRTFFIGITGASSLKTV
jgi:hypothetical protein